MRTAAISVCRLTRFLVSEVVREAQEKVRAEPGNLRQHFSD
jgi:hypothetical protein